MNVPFTSESIVCNGVPLLRIKLTSAPATVAPLRSSTVPATLAISSGTVVLNEEVVEIVMLLPSGRSAEGC